MLIRFFARILANAFPKSAAMRLVERIVSWLAWGVAVLWIVGLLPAVRSELSDVAIHFGKSQVTALTLIEGSLSATVVMLLALWLSSTVERRLLDRTIVDLSMRKVAANATRAGLLLVGLLFALSAVGVDLTALSVLGGAVGVGLGFGLQKLASNYVSGFVILLERSLRIGDNVRVDGFEGRITDIKTRYTLIRAGNGRESIVPNETLITQRVENLSDADRKFNITTNITVGYDSDVARVQAILCGAAAAQPRVLPDPAPVAYLVNFAPDGLEFSLNFWVSDPSAGTVNLRSAINIAILTACAPRASISPIRSAWCASRPMAHRLRGPCRSRMSHKRPRRRPRRDRTPLYFRKKHDRSFVRGSHPACPSGGGPPLRPGPAHRMDRFTLRQSINPF